MTNNGGVGKPHGRIAARLVAADGGAVMNRMSVNFFVRSSLVTSKWYFGMCGSRCSRCGCASKWHTLYALVCWCSNLTLHAKNDASMFACLADKLCGCLNGDGQTQTYTHARTLHASVDQRRPVRPRPLFKWQHERVNTHSYATARRTVLSPI